ncbi:hypothetical protein HYPSUDRAFT_762659 [Hypholoma sublateritium FD-334 SS-4]|uniref:Uncharacterized protein n=1 Tax=Hypholoma sublateritium (strain FD-334 SS-4) TaxID=945553 RepID=A0A0D2NWN8_HYPSF|nr:hypothetical protein HYPSUDRAFT_762659 [Hypholoma sublateritium FD-334 SS-4]
MLTEPLTVPADLCLRSIPPCPPATSHPRRLHLLFHPAGTSHPRTFKPPIHRSLTHLWWRLRFFCAVCLQRRELLSTPPPGSPLVRICLALHHLIVDDPQLCEAAFYRCWHSLARRPRCTCLDSPPDRNYAAQVRGGRIPRNAVST